MTNHRNGRPRNAPSDNAGSTRPLHVYGAFAGIGGIEVGLRSAGHRTIGLCEADVAAIAVLRRRFPEVVIDDDIRRVTALPPKTDLVAAGFPCQDLSQVGRTAGLRGKHSGLIRHLLDLLERRPVPWLLLENVPFMIHL